MDQTACRQHNHRDHRHALNIGQAAAASGVSAKMIRHYESVGLLAAAKRSASGYRIYSDADVHSLRFVRQARDHGFAIKEIAELLSLWQNRRRSSKAVKELASRHLAALDHKIQQLEQMKRALRTLAERCSGDDRPHCPILEGLAGTGAPCTDSAEIA
jgi:Cu(I)-responsive transcriptional regulator